MGFFHELFHRSAPVDPTDKGNGAVGTPVVTPLSDLQIGTVAPVGQYSVSAHFADIFVLKGGIGLFFQYHFDGVYDFFVAAGPQNCIHLWHLLQNLLSVALTQTPRDHNRLQVPVLFQPRHIQNVVNAFLFRTFNESTGIDDHHIGINILRHNLIARLTDQIHHALGIDLIFAAP